MPKANTSLTFPCGITMPNRFLLAPMTNRQSHEDGIDSGIAHDFNWEENLKKLKAQRKANA